VLFLTPSGILVSSLSWETAWNFDLSIGRFVVEKRKNHSQAWECPSCHPTINVRALKEEDGLNITLTDFHPVNLG